MHALVHERMSVCMRDLRLPRLKRALGQVSLAVAYRYRYCIYNCSVIALIRRMKKQPLVCVFTAENCTKNQKPEWNF